jgi:EAL domain-containing protein (putative c-di-GMP-specific phosphodiesterase class I)/DNA-binding response OmpR family regulator
MGDRPLVLVTEDDATMRAFLDETLRRSGMDTVLAANGQEALEHLERLPVDVLLLDMHMPVLDGLSTLSVIRASERLRTLPVILVTGSVEEADRIGGLESGADDYLAKPVAASELVARIRAHLRGRTAWASELERGREDRRRISAALQGLPADGNLLTLAGGVADRLTDLLEVNGISILHFNAAGVQVIASSGAARERFELGRAVPEKVGAEITERAGSGPWIEGRNPRSGARRLDFAFVPYRLGPTASPVGAIVFAAYPGTSRARLSHRLADLVDATTFVVAVLRPAVEHADTNDVVINRIRDVITEHGFESHFQPIVWLATGEHFGAEALTRFADGSPPEQWFIEAATVGLGLSLERAAIARALEIFEDAPPELVLSVNLSADVLLHEATLPQLLARTDRQLIVELTEHERIDDYEAVAAALQRLGSNVRLAIDDAGSGFASLRHIFALRPSFVKLDIEWVRGIDRDPVRRSLVSGLAFFALETGSQLIAEGIETEAELAAIRALGIQLGQGFLLGRPEPRHAARRAPRTVSPTVPPAAMETEQPALEA